MSRKAPWPIGWPSVPLSAEGGKMAYRISHIAYRRIKFLLFAICYLLFANLMGCAMIKETAKGVAGLSTKVLEEGRKNAIKKTFNYDYNVCYNKVRDILSHTGTCIYAQDAQKAMIAVYVSTEDTTPVGVFFKEIDADNTQVEVSSPSKYAKELISARIFDILNPPEKKDELATPQKNQKEP